MGGGDVEISVVGVGEEGGLLPGSTVAGEALLSLAAEARLSSLVVVVECETFIRRPSRLSFSEEAEMEHHGHHTSFQGQEELLAEPRLFPAGQSRLAFAVPLSAQAPGSLSSADKGRNGKLRLRYQIAYFAKAEVELESGLRKLSDRVAFRVQEPSTLAQFPAYFGFVYHKEAEEVVNSGFFRRHSGSVRCSLEIQRHHFSPGEQIHMVITLKNDSKRTIKGVDVELNKFEHVVRKGEPVREELDWPSTPASLVLRERLKRRLPPGATEEIRSSIQLPAELAFTTSPVQPRLISTRYELSLRLAKRKHVLHATELLILPPTASQPSHAQPPHTQTPPPPAHLA